MDIQQRIDKLMKQNNIDTYITLLRKIFKCSVRDESKTDVQWATNQKSNFTNMLKGKRPFTVEIFFFLIFSSFRKQSRITLLQYAKLRYCHSVKLFQPLALRYVLLNKNSVIAFHIGNHK